MRLTILALVAALSTGCATLNGDMAKFTGMAITDSEKLHCGTAGSPAQPLCLNDGQFQKVNADLAKVSQAGLAYTIIAAAASNAKQQTPADAVITLLSAFSSAMADIHLVLGDAFGVILTDLKSAVKAL